MTYSTPAGLEQVLQHSGDDLYRLAVLLAPDPSQASDAILRMARRLAAAPGAALGPRELGEALLAALPPERRARPGRLPRWAQHPEPRSPEARLLAAVARLPREQRMVLGRTMLHLLEPTALAAGGPAEKAAGAPAAADVRALRRDALLAIAKGAGYAELARDLVDEAVPEACLAARAALALDDPAVRQDPAVRGHLALCAQCRAIAQEWQSLGVEVEGVLRGAFREVRMPESLLARIRASLSPQHSMNAAPLRRFATGPWPRRALLPLAVVLLIAWLVMPRAAPEVEQAPAQAAAGPVDIAELVARAERTLYAPPGDGVWHTRYALRWFFPDGSYAPLRGEIWNDPATGRQRVQLAHEAGGGPYDFALADGDDRLWYAVTDTYAESIYPLIREVTPARVQLAIGPADQQRVMAARLETGAWGLAAAYLRQARGAALQSWGRQGAEDGTPLEVIGFSGVGLLAQGGLSGARAQTTILLLVNPEDGRLWEVRELTGPPGGEQISRTTWRYLGGERLREKGAIDRAFNLSTAYNGTGRFTTVEDRLALPALPLVPADAVIPLARALEGRMVPMAFPASPPPGTRDAALISDGTGSGAIAVYLGEGRRLAIRAMRNTVANAARFSTEGRVEELTIAGRPTLLRPLLARGYEALIRPASPRDDTPLLQVSAQGYEREELLATLETLSPLTIDIYRAQSELFASNGSQNQEAIDALLGALAEPPAPDPVRYTAVRIYLRHGGDDPLADPYHRRLYGGRPEELVSESWARRSGQAGALETVTAIGDGAGTVYEVHHAGIPTPWSYFVPERTVKLLPADTAPAMLAQIPLLPEAPAVETMRATALRLLACGDNRIEQQDNGMRIVARSEFGWRQRSCMQPEYPELFRVQAATPRLVVTDGQSILIQPSRQLVPSSSLHPDDGPYLLGVNEDVLTTRIFFDASGRPTRSETRSGTTLDGVLLEAWELIDERQVAESDVPQQTFDAAAPEALITIDLSQSLSVGPVVASLTVSDALDFAGTPLFEPQDPGVVLSRDTNIDGSGLTTGFVGMGGRIFEEAMWRGMAIQYRLRSPSLPNVPPLTLYQGRADTFGAFLQSRAYWQSSTQARVRIADLLIDAWAVSIGGETWVLAEIEGTLLAYPSSNSDYIVLLANMRRVETPAEPGGQETRSD